MPAPKRTKPSVPATYAQIMVRLAEKEGFSRDAIQSRLGFRIPSGRFRGMAERLSIEQQERLAKTIIQIGEEHGADASGFGYSLGLKLAPMTHGFLGPALLSQMTARAGVRLFLRLRPLILPGVRVDLIEEGETDRIRVQEDLMLSSDLSPLFYEMVLSAMWRFAHSAIDPDPSRFELHFTHPEPPCFSQYRSVLPVCHFDSPANELHFPAEYMNTQLSTGDPIAAQEFEDQCEEELALLENEDDTVSRVRSILKGGSGKYPDLETVSRELCVSPATLRRRLKQQGASFRNLIDEARKEEAQYLLANTSLSLEQIAERLGYQDPGNFTRAFTRWTGCQPSTWREGNGASAHGGQGQGPGAQ